MEIEVIEELLNSTDYNTAHNHIISDCPFCLKEGHFYLNIQKIFKKNEKGQYISAFDCKKCSETGNLKKLLKQFDREHLLEEESLNISKFAKKSIFNAVLPIEQEKILKKVNLPSGFKRLFHDEYLESRGFLQRDYTKYIIGKTDLLFKYNNYIIIGVVEDGEVKGFVSRSKIGKEEIKVINKINEESGRKKKFLRYINSKTDFSKLLFGLDEIGYSTEWVILVEGIFDKFSVDRALDLDFDMSMKCCVTFGKSISHYQIDKLKKKGIKNLIIIQDPDAVKESKRHANDLNSDFNVLVGYTGDNDLGDSTKYEILNVMNNLRTPKLYSLNTILKRKLL